VEEPVENSHHLGLGRDLAAVLGMIEAGATQAFKDLNR
jgi:hypothetical protein